MTKEIYFLDQLLIKQIMNFFFTELNSFNFHLNRMSLNRNVLFIKILNIW